MVATTHWMAVVALGALLASPAGAETPQERSCKLFVDQVTADIRANGIEPTKRHLPRLRRCEIILKAALDREARKIVDDFNRSKAAPPPAP